MTKAQLKSSAIATFKNEAQALLNLADKIDDKFVDACEYLLATKGRVIVVGMGKSGHIAGKIASTFSSLGTPSFFLHPAEAIHGDLGMITKEDTVIALSYSGNTPEITTLIPSIKRLGVPLIALCGNANSILANEASLFLDVSIDQEACPLGLAPTTSTTASIAMGDALAIALLQAKGFTKEDFARSHPGGSLGKKLLLKVDHLWKDGEALPCVTDTINISQALIEVTEKKLGMTCVINNEGELVGVYTDGDIRRTLNEQLDIHTTPISKVMTRQCKTISAGIMATEALDLMKTHSITSLVVTDTNNNPHAVIHLHDILRAGIA